MPRFLPFRGLGYDLTQVILDDVVAPPYDVVDERARQKLAGRSPYNAIHIELPVADGNGGLDPYDNAARTLAWWLEKGVVVGTAAGRSTSTGCPSPTPAAPRTRRPASSARW